MSNTVYKAMSDLDVPSPVNVVVADNALTKSELLEIVDTLLKGFKHEMDEFKQDLHTELTEFKQEIHTELAEFKQETNQRFDNIDARLDRIETETKDDILVNTHDIRALKLTNGIVDSRPIFTVDRIIGLTYFIGQVFTSWFTTYVHPKRD